MTTLTLTQTVAAPSSLPSKLSRYAATGARCSLGLLFFVCGLNGLLSFIPPPAEPMPEAAVAFGVALVQTGYMLPLISGTEAVAGALLLANRWIPLALTLLAPIVVNIFAFHLYLTPGSYGMAVAVVVLQAFLAWTQRAAYRPLFAPRQL